MEIRFLLVDALNLIRRIYAAHPGEEGPAHTDSAIESTVHSLQRAVRETGPTHAACIFDSHEPGWRHALLPTYKEGRPPMPEQLHKNLDRYKTAFLEMGITSLVFSQTEADDLIATLATKTAQKNGRAIILSTDKAFLQLLSANIRIRDHFSKRDLDRKYVQEKYSVRPEQLVDLFALAGDTTNRIPGVPKVGLKTAAKLLLKYQSVTDLLSQSAFIEGKMGETIRKHIPEIKLSQQLFQLKADISLGINLKTLRYRS